MNWRKGSPRPTLFTLPKMNYYCYCCGERKVEAGREREKKGWTCLIFLGTTTKKLVFPAFFPLGIFYYYYKGDRRRRIALILLFFREEKEEEETFSLDFTILRL